MYKQKGLALILVVILIATASVGYFIYQNQKPVIVPPVVKASPSPVSKSVATDSADIANWKTYTNPEYAYQISYPSNWKVDREERNKQTFKSLVQFSQINPKTLYNFVIVVESKPYGTLFSELKEITSRYKGSITMYKLNSSISGQRAVYISGAGHSDYNVHILFENQGNAFSIEAYFTNPPSQSELSQFNQILSTFRFLP